MEQDKNREPIEGEMPKTLSNRRRESTQVRGRGPKAIAALAWKKKGFISSQSNSAGLGSQP